MEQNNNLLFLQDFNKAIDNVLKEVSQDKYMSNLQSYDFTINSVNMICRRMSYQNESFDTQISVMHEDKIFELMLDFFKSIDIELYNKARAIIENRYPNTKTYIYDFHKADPNHSTFYSVQYEDGKARLFLPLGYSLSKSELESIHHEHGDDFYTLDDLYSIVHEISHLLDINPEKYTKEPLRTRDILTEITPNVFELMLSEYLLSKGIFEESVIKDKKVKKNNSLFTHANLCRIKLGFLELKKKKGEIAQEDIEAMMKEDILGENEFINIINLIVNSGVSVIENRRYAFAGMYAPIIFQKCKASSNQGLLQKYLYECSENIPFTDILHGFGIDIKSDIYKYLGEENKAKLPE